MPFHQLTMKLFVMPRSIRGLSARNPFLIDLPTTGDTTSMPDSCHSIHDRRLNYEHQFMPCRLEASSRIPPIGDSVAELSPSPGGFHYESSLPIY